MVRISKHRSLLSPDSPGNDLVIPLAHHENIYALPDDLAARVAHVARRVAMAMRRGYPCDGVTVRQNNEPAGGQDVWHLHTHVIPRHADIGSAESRVVRPDDAERRRSA
ncbi:MAG: HIT domain-containing protein [Chloroflexi bacterium]|nr:HIT domain-containing protein [Chloroflexota bacterium]